MKQIKNNRIVYLLVGESSVSFVIYFSYDGHKTMKNPRLRRTFSFHPSYSQAVDSLAPSPSPEIVSHGDKMSISLEIWLHGNNPSVDSDGYQNSNSLKQKHCGDNLASKKGQLESHEYLEHVVEKES